MDASLGPLASHMLQHILTMNLAAPIIVLALRRHLPDGLWRVWPLATLLQLGLLWGWHAPRVFDAAMADTSLLLAMHLSLFASALLFWGALATMPGDQQWRSIFALLITGKLFCLLGVLLTFSPRVLFGHSHGTAHGASALADQQLAGLWMLIACPLTYVAAGIFVSWRWLRDIEKRCEDNGRPA
ncbi:cytochrome c oxidase assembly protein [Rhodoligotrophos defluvii]|uniref:cytochrome c oxidase assembly protein n=1 Tax=Rhodoligotrophos defluvii TaxID=2561934 RepID=UPI0010C964AA|nr:cytochrome c oxidase assembly protein [Rhodoligotrophos defluvii]